MHRQQGQARGGLDLRALRRAVWIGDRYAGAPTASPDAHRQTCHSPGTRAVRAPQAPARTETPEAAWRRLGEHAARDGWARRFLLDVAHGRLALVPEATIPALARLAQSEPEAVVRLVKQAHPMCAPVAAAALGRAGRFHQQLVAFSLSADVKVRLAAVAGFAEEAARGRLEAVEGLGDLTRDPAGEVRSAATAALGRSRKGAIPAALDWLGRAGNTGDQRALAGAARGAAWLYPARRRDAVALLQQMARRGPAGRSAVAAVIGELPRLAAARLAGSLASDPEPRVRAMVAAAFGRWVPEGSAAARAALARMTRDGSMIVRGACATALAATDGGWSDLASSMARDHSSLVRAAVADAAAGRQGHQAADALLTLATDKTSAVRARALSALGAIGMQAPLREALSDRDPAVLAAVAAALEPQSPEDVERLLSLTRHRSGRVAQAAAGNLSRRLLSLNGRAARRVAQLAREEPTAPSVAQGIASVMDSDPHAALAVCQLLLAETTPDFLWRVARSANSPDAADLARSAARVLAADDDPSEALRDLGMALDWVGLSDASRVCSWLAQCAGADTREMIAEVGPAPNASFRPVEHLSAAARSTRKAVLSRSNAARSRHHARATAALAVLSEECGSEAHWPVIRTIVAAWRQALGSGAEAPAHARPGAPSVPASGSLIAAPRARHLVRLSRDAGAPRVAALSGLHNPFVVGKPLSADSSMFFGRAAEIEFVERALASGDDGNVVVLVGQRRIGKTSILRRLEARLASSYGHHPVFVDVQGMLVANTGAFFQELARRCLPMAADAASDRVAGADMVRDAADRLGRQVVLLLDEFDDLDSKVRAKVLDAEVFSQFRNLVQHSPGINIVLCGTHRLEELAGEHWSFLLNLATHRRIGLLGDEAADVIRVPLAGLGITCDQPAVDHIVGLAGRHPYFLQLLGYRLVERCIESGEAVIRLDTAEGATGEVVEQGEVHLRYLWEMVGSQGQQVIRALAPADGGLTLDELRRSSGLSSRQLRRTLRELAISELVRESAGRFAIEIGLLSRWLATPARRRKE